MIYTKEVENMCPVNKGAYHGPAPIPQEGKWVQVKEVADISGIVLTKLDGTAKGGIAIAIQAQMDVPVKYIGIGEKIDDLQKFNPDEFVNALFEIK